MQLDRGAKEQQSRCPSEDDVLDSEFNYSQEMPLLNSMTVAIADAAVTLSNTVPAETQPKDCLSNPQSHSSPK